MLKHSEVYKSIITKKLSYTHKQLKKARRVYMLRLAQYFGNGTLVLMTICSATTYLMSCIILGRVMNTHGSYGEFLLWCVFMSIFAGITLTLAFLYDILHKPVIL